MIVPPKVARQICCQNFIHLSRYARWNDELKRRETWEETIQRYFDFFVPYLEQNHNLILTPEEIQVYYNTIHDLKVMPSMRCLMTAGKALTRDHVAAYNCSALAIDSPRAFDEIMYIAMCGTGVGFSVE